MQEYGSYIRESLQNGLLPTLSAPTGARGLVKCPGFVPRDLALEEEPLLTAMEADHFINTEKSLLAVLEDTGTYSLVRVTDAGTTNLITAPVEDIQDAQGTIALAAEDTYRGVEVNGYILLVNGDQLFFYHAADEGWLGASQSNGLIPSSLCVWNDRLVMAGFQHSDTQAFWAGEAWWTPIWDEIKLSFPSFVLEKYVQGDAGIDGSYVVVGPPGSSRDHAFTLELLMLYGEGDRRGLILEALRMGLLKVVRIPWGGTILEARQVGNRVVLFGDQGVGMMSQTDAGDILVQRLESFGLLERDAVAGNIGRLVFISNTEKLYDVDAQYQIRNLQFESFVKELFDE